MNKLSSVGTQTQIIPFLSRLGDLEYFEGPVLTLYKSVLNNKLYLFDWVDQSDRCNRWMVYEVKPDFVHNYINCEITQLELFDSSNGIKCYMDIFSNNTIHSQELYQIDIIPDDYLPNNVYFDKSLSIQIEKIQIVVRSMINKTTNLFNYSLQPKNNIEIPDCIFRRPLLSNKFVSSGY
jgi:hypothetical protein